MILIVYKLYIKPFFGHFYIDFRRISVASLKENFGTIFMKKTTRVSLLVFTVVAAILAFGVLWYTRPGAPSYVLEEAKARQGVSLLEVTSPAMQTPPLKIDLDYDTITAKVKENLVDDESFSAVMANSVASSASSIVDTKIDSFRTEFDNKLSNQSTYILKELNQKIDSNYKDLISKIASSTAYQEQIDLVNSKIENLTSYLDDYNSRLDTIYMNVEDYSSQVNNPNNYSVDINSYIPQIVDSIIPEVTSNILTTIDDNKDIIFSNIYDMSKESISDEEVLAIYNKYRTNLIMDLTPAILDKIEAQITSNFVKDNNESVLETKVVEPIVNEVKQEPTVEVKEEVLIPSKPSFKTTPAVSEIIRTNTIKIIAVSDGSSIQELDKSSDKTITMPQFEETPSIEVINPVEYEEKRQEIRDKAIKDILKFIE